MQSAADWGPAQVPGAPPPRANRSPASRGAVTFLVCAVYFTMVQIAAGLLAHLLVAAHPGVNGPLLELLLEAVLLLAGFLLIAKLHVPELRAWSAVGFVRRPSAGRELGLGAAVGWAAGVLLVLPGVLLLHMHSELLLDGFHFGAMTASALVLLLTVLVRQVALCGLPFRSLSQATSPLFASIAFAGAAALLTNYSARGDVGEVLLAAMAQIVLSVAATRTRAVWLGGTLQFLWGFTVTILFGLPSFLWPRATGVVVSGMRGPRWLTGGLAGPETALWGGVVIAAALLVVWRLTRDYAWHYTYEPAVGAGYPMDVAPPAEHTRMEEAAQKAAPLVQIGGVAPVRTADPDGAKYEPGP